MSKQQAMIELGERELAFELGFKRCMSNLYGSIFGKGQYQVIRINIYHRAAGDWLAVACAPDPVDGTPMVAFGNGATALYAMMGLDKSMAARKWKPDRPAVNSTSVRVVPQSGGLGVRLVQVLAPSKPVPKDGDKSEDFM